MEFEFCLEHKNKRLNLICTQCDRGDVPMCDGCLEKNQKHYAHFNEPRPELELNRLPVVANQKELLDLDKICLTSMTKLERLDEFKSKERDAIKKTITRDFDTVRGKLRDAEQMAKKKVDDIYEGFKSKIFTSLDELAKNRQDIMNFQPSKSDVNSFVAEMSQKPIQVDVEATNEKPLVKINVPSYFVINATADITEEYVDVLRQNVDFSIQPLCSPMPKKPEVDDQKLANLERQKLSIDTNDQIKITSVTTPSYFYVIRVKDVPKMVKIAEIIQRKADANEMVILDNVQDLKIGSKCLVKRKFIRFDEGDMWARAEVISPMDDETNTIRLQHIDFGKIQKIEVNKTAIYYPIEEVFDANFPILAILCSLHNVAPRLAPFKTPFKENKIGWSDSAIIHLQDLTKMKRTMYAKVVVPEDEDESENSDVTSVNVFMKKNNDEHLSYVSDYLVFKGNANYIDHAMVLHHRMEKIVERFQFVDLPPEVLYEGSVHRVELTRFDEEMMDMCFLIKTSDNGEDHGSKLSTILDNMEKYYKEYVDDGDIAIDCPRVGQPCAVLTQVNLSQTTHPGYFRGEIIEIRPGCPISDFDVPNANNAQVRVLFVDEGMKIWKNLSDIRTLPAKFMQTPSLAVTARLSGIKPHKIGEKWTEDAKLALSKACHTTGLIMCVDTINGTKQHAIPADVTLYDISEHSLLCINAFMVWGGFSQLHDPKAPFLKRIEYMLRDPLELLLYEKNGKDLLPVYSAANFTEEMKTLTDDKTSKSCILISAFMTEETNEVIVLLQGSGKKQTETNVLTPDINKQYKEYSETGQDLLERKVGEFCAIKVLDKWFRGRISRMTKDDIEEVITIDSGEWIRVTNENTIMPLFANFQSNLDQTVIPYKLKGVIAVNMENIITAIEKLTDKTMLTILKDDVMDEKEFEVVQSLAFVNLDELRLGQGVPEIDLVAQIICNVKPFSDGDKHWFNIGSRLKELGLAKVYKNDFDLTKSAKPTWLEATLPSREDYDKLRESGQEGRLKDFQGQWLYIDVDSSIYVIPQEVISTLSGINAEICCHFQNSKAKFHDQYWFIGEPCMALFSWDKRWYRATVMEILTDNKIKVKLLDYGNEDICQIEDLRKDLYGLEVPKLSSRLILDGLKLTECFDPLKLHNDLADQYVNVELTKPPTEWPLTANVSAVQSDIDVRSMMRFHNMAL